jgi:hypothetical protein
MESLRQGKDAIHDDIKQSNLYSIVAKCWSKHIEENQRKQWIFIRRRKNSSHWPRSQSRANINILHIPQLIKYWRITSTSSGEPSPSPDGVRGPWMAIAMKHCKTLGNLNEVVQQAKNGFKFTVVLAAVSVPFSPSPHRSFGMNFFQLAPRWEARLGPEARRPGEVAARWLSWSRLGDGWGAEL